MTEVGETGVLGRTVLDNATAKNVDVDCVITLSLKTKVKTVWETMRRLDSVVIVIVQVCTIHIDKNENCTISIPKGNSYCRRNSSARGPRF